MTRSLRPTGRSRWLVPVAAAALVVGGPAVASLSADRVDLPPRTAEQLLVDLQDADVQAFSGTVATAVDLGLPALPGVGAEASPGALLDGENVVRVWRDGADRSRVAVLGDNGEYVLVRDGRTVWTYASADRAATRLELPAATGEDAAAQQGAESPLTPELLAQTVLLTLDQSSDVTVDGSALVAGRPAYELVVTPRSQATLIGSVRLAVDAETSMPLRVEVLPRGSEDPAVSVGYTDLELETPDAGLFDFTPPPGAEVERFDAGDLPAVPGPGATAGGDAGDRGEADDRGDTGETGDRQDDTATGGPQVQRVGTGFDTVVLGSLPEAALTALSGGGDAGDDQRDGRDEADAARVLETLPEVSGPWGTGRLVQGTLFSAVLTDDGRLAVGAVTPQTLYAALAK